MGIKYLRLGGEDLDIAGALSQAAHVLDIAAEIAVDSKNVEHIVTVAQSFMLIADRLAGEASDIEKPKFGFHHHGEELESEYE